MTKLPGAPFHSVHNPRFLVGAAVLCTIGLIGSIAAYRQEPVTYTAQIQVAVRPNTGGSPITYYTDASAQSVQWVQPSMLNSARRSLSGSALRDPSAIYRVKCAPVDTDSIVSCRTTGDNSSAIRAVLNQMVAVLIPAEATVLNGGYQQGIIERQEQWEQDGRKIARMKHQLKLFAQHPGRPGQATLLRFDHSSMAMYVSVRGKILHQIAAIRRQIQHTAGAFVTLGSGATIVQQARPITWLVAISIFGLLWIATVLLALVGRGRVTTATKVVPALG